MKSKSLLWSDKYNFYRLRYEAYFFSEARHCHISLNLNSEDGCRGIMLAWAIPWIFSIYLTINLAWLNKLLPKEKHPAYGLLPVEKSFELSWHNGCIWWDFYRTEGQWCADDPWWMHGNIPVVDIVCGKMETEESEEHIEDVVIPMPEGNYEAKARAYTVKWWRPRFSKMQQIRRVSFDYAVGIPVPGKGTTSYNCDDTAMLGGSVPAEAIEEAIGLEVGSILAKRRRYGGRNWEPRDGWPQDQTEVVELGHGKILVSSGTYEGEAALMFYEAVGKYEIGQRADLDDPGYQKDPVVAITFREFACVEVCFLQLDETLMILKGLKDASTEPIDNSDLNALLEEAIDQAHTEE